MDSSQYELIFLPETDSTNLQASALLSERTGKKPFVVRSGYQKSGKGQSDNAWVSEKDRNLLCSIAVFPNQLDISNHFYLSKITALALYDTLCQYISKPEIKWPNDILVHNKKIAGVLIENSLQDKNLISSVIGIGVNVNQASFPKFAPEAASILNETGVHNDVDEVLARLLDQFDYWLGVLVEGSLQTIDSYYLEHLFRFNKIAPYQVSGYEFDARIVGVEADGHLLLETAGKERLRFGFKEVAFT